MSFLQTADDLVDNSINTLTNVLNSKITQFLSGNGTPILVDYYNISDTMSTLNLGDYTVDQVLGPESPIRYNKITDFPLVGLRELIPSKEELDGRLYDLSLDGEVTLFPNTIKPNGYDHFVYTFPNTDTQLVFRVVDFEFSSVKSNDFYKISITLRDMNGTTDSIELLEKQTVKRSHAILEDIGTQEKCIIEDTIYNTIESINKVIDYMTEQYVDLFYDARYNCLLCRHDKSDFLVYDPYLTHFVMSHNLLDRQNRYINLVQYDNRATVKVNYNQSLFHYIELQDITKLEPMLKQPITFATTSTNPFYYYGEDTAFTLDLQKIPRVTFDMTNITDEMYYFPKLLFQKIIDNDLIIPIEPIEKVPEEPTFVDDELIENITEITLDDAINIFPEDMQERARVNWNLIISYLNRTNLYGLLEESKVKLNDLLKMDLDGDYETFLFTPVILYIMIQYVDFIRNNTI